MGTAARTESNAGSNAGPRTGGSGAGSGRPWSRGAEREDRRARRGMAPCLHVGPVQHRRDGAEALRFALHTPSDRAASSGPRASAAPHHARASRDPQRVGCSPGHLRAVAPPGKIEPLSRDVILRVERNRRRHRQFSGWQLCVDRDRLRVDPARPPSVRQPRVAPPSALHPETRSS